MNFRLFVAILVFSATAAAALARADPPATPYAGQQTRAIKALSPEDVAGLLKGDGMGMAKAAELNGYPGPAHILALADRLGLTANQRRKVQAIFNRMSAAAKILGPQLVECERELDRLFATGEVTPARVAEATAAAAALQGRLRAAHLSAHLEARALLDPAQIALYRQLRGYSDPAMPAHHHHG
jgi:Spy/CpxP family protein refolding chaperone